MCIRDRVKDRIHIRREYALVIIVDRYCRISPPQERLWHRGSVIQFAFNLQIGNTRSQSEPRHPFLVKHLFHFADPYRNTAVRKLLNVTVNTLKRTWTMVLRPVEFDTARDPG